MTTTAVGRITALPGDAFARLALKLDAAVSAANGLVYLAAADALDGPLGMPAGFIRGVGAFFLVFAVCVAYVATRPELNRRAVAAVAALNVLWVIDSLALVAFGWYEPTTGGSVWTVLQAAAVAGLAALQTYGLRRAS